MLRPYWITSPCCQRLSIRVQESKLAEIQLTNPSLDLRSIAYDHPHQVIGTDRFLRRAGGVRNRQGADALRVGLEVVIVQPECHELLERALHRGHRFPIAGQRQRQIRLRFCQLVSGHGLGPENARSSRSTSIIDSFVLSVWTGAYAMNGRWPRASQMNVNAPYDQCFASRRFMLTREVNCPPSSEVIASMAYSRGLAFGGARSPAKMIDCSAPGRSRM